MLYLCCALERKCFGLFVNNISMPLPAIVFYGFSLSITHRRIRSHAVHSLWCVCECLSKIEWRQSAIRHGMIELMNLLFCCCDISLFGVAVAVVIIEILCGVASCEHKCRWHNSCSFTLLWIRSRRNRTNESGKPLRFIYLFFLRFISTSIKVRVAILSLKDVSLIKSSFKNGMDWIIMKTMWRVMNKVTTKRLDNRDFWLHVVHVILMIKKETQIDATEFVNWLRGDVMQAFYFGNLFDSDSGQCLSMKLDFVCLSQAVASQTLRIIIKKNEFSRFKWNFYSILSFAEVFIWFSLIFEFDISAIAA